MSFASREWALDLFKKAFKKFNMVYPYLIPISLQSAKNTSTITYTYTADKNRYIMVAAISSDAKADGNSTITYTCETEAIEIFNDHWSYSPTSWGSDSYLYIYKVNENQTLNITAAMENGNGYTSCMLGVYIIDGVNLIENVTKIWESRTSNNNSISTTYTPTKKEYYIRLGMYQNGNGSNSPGELYYSATSCIKVHSNCPNLTTTVVSGGIVYNCCSLYESIPNILFTISQSGSSSSYTSHVGLLISFTGE